MLAIIYELELQIP